MTKTALVQVRMEPELKKQADAVLASLGINASAAISLFYSQMVRQRGIPFELKVPNESLQEAMRELEDPEFHKTAKGFTNMDDLIKSLES